LLYLKKNNFGGMGITMEGANPGIIFKDAAGTMYGQIEVLTASGDMAQYVGSGAAQLGWYTKANGNVGIGTTAPLSKLGVLGSASIGATYGAIVAPTSGLIIEGNVGIGTTAPTNARLHIEGSGVHDAALRLVNTGTSGGNFFLTAANSSWGVGGDKLLFGINNPESGNVKMVLEGTGNVGIGTTSPDFKLAPSILAFPDTSNLKSGLVVPMPTLPFNIVFVIEPFPKTTELLPAPTALYPITISLSVPSALALEL
jgi:hypothetical protein